MRGKGASAEPRRNRRPRTDGTAQHPQSHHGSAGQPAPQRGGNAPWHFWLVVVMATVYLGWRAIEGVVWLVQWFSGHLS